MKCFGLMAAVLLAALAFGAPRAATAAAKIEPYSKEQLARGAKEAPAVVQSAALPCTVVDSAFISEGEAKNPDDPKSTKEIKVSSYEVACQNSMGYILQNYAGLPVKMYDCVSLADTPSPCRLSENLDTKKLVGTIVSAAGKTCTVTNERALGATKAGDRFYEVACTEGPGFVIQAHAPTSDAKPIAEDCSRTVGTNLECKFTTKEQIAAAMNATLTALINASGKTCALSGSRQVGADSSGLVYYEVACGPGVGYFMAERNGQFVRAIDCANARAIGGGCTLTDATKAESAESGTYSKLAAAGGYNCQVTKYRYIGLDNKSNSEVVELQCANRPDGAVALFPTDNKGKPVFYDCVAAAALGESCKLSDVSAVFDKYTQSLVAKGKKTCKVSGAKWLGRTADGTNYIETACSDGLPGWVVAQTPSGTAGEVLTCGQAKSAGVACSLPSNVK